MERFGNAERLPANIDIDTQSLEILRAIAHEQRDPAGKRYIFAPNHVEPAAKIRQQTGVADDFPVLKKVLNAVGVRDVRPIARGDTDMHITGPASEKLYHAHRAVWSKAGELVADALPVNINAHESSRNMQSNVGNVMRIVDVLKDKEANIALYPYAKWFTSGTQDISEDTALPEGGFLRAVDEGDPAYETWRNSLKRGAFALSRLTDAPVVPVYVEQREGKWSFRVGEPITLSHEQADNGEEEMARNYVHAMRALKAKAAGRG